MGESVCLRRSLSHPCSASREFKEGDPIRCLTESVSFGRFVSESLAWEKWSTFSHNRYLEEVEKFSKPGLVAQKRAYFEAHYKKRLKAATESLSDDKEPRAPVADVPGLEDISATNGSEPSTEVELAVAQNNDACDKDQKKDDIPAVAASSLDASTLDPRNERSELKMGEAETPENGKRHVEESSSRSGKPSHLVGIVICTNSTTNQINTTLDKEVADQQIPTLLEKDQVISFSKSSSQRRLLKLPLPHGNGMTTSMQPRNVSNAVLKGWNAVTLIKKKTSSSKSLHMSVNFASAGADCRKSNPPVVLQSRKKDTTRPEKLQKDKSVSQKAQTMASLSIKQVNAAATPASEYQRSKTHPNKSISGVLTADDKSNSLSISKCSSVNGSRARLTTICSPFSFRSEERAVKRREFLQKREEKSTKAEQDPRKTQRIGFETRQESCQGSHSMVSWSKGLLTRSQSSKLRTQPAPDKCHNTRSRPP